MYKIKAVSKYLFDVFHGDGWQNCCRVRKDKFGHLNIVKTWGNTPKTLINDIGRDLK